jgi:pyridoxal phosphate enzyme (YggS family)
MRKIDACPGATFDLIGTLQRNKVSRVVGAVRLIHSVDSLRLLQAIDARARALGISQEVLLQINVSGEESKHGFAPEELPEVLEAAQPLSGVRVTGLMTMAPLGDPDAARPYFRRLRELSQDVGLDRLSMGMSDDFEVAIEEGATLIRVGSALFGSAESSAVLR